MYGTDQNVKSSNVGKEYIKLLTDKRSQILNSNSLEENSCEVLEEKKISSNLVAGLGEKETKVLEKLRSPVPLHMSLKDSDEKVNDKTTIVLKDMDRMKSSERMVDYSKCKPISSLSLLTFDARPIPPDVDEKIKSESKELMKMKDIVVPWKIKAHEKFGTAIELHLLGERSNIYAFYCVLKSERELKSLWDD